MTFPNIGTDPSASRRDGVECELARVATLAPSKELLAHEEIGSENLRKYFFLSENSLLKERA